jgi:energy-coupling factor transporter ATP-binding protein EcfA2
MAASLPPTDPVVSDLVLSDLVAANGSTVCTGILVGDSGNGKSSLVNTLLRLKKQDTSYCPVGHGTCAETTDPKVAVVEGLPVRREGQELPVLADMRLVRFGRLTQLWYQRQAAELQHTGKESFPGNISASVSGDVWSVCIMLQVPTCQLSWSSMFASASDVSTPYP